MDNHRLVYSTDKGRVCERCQKPTDRCGCKKEQKVKKNQASPGYPDDGIVRIRREVKGRRGKTVTVVFGLPLSRPTLRQFAKDLKQSCGSGGSAKDGIVVIQGDHRETLRTAVRKQGYTVKIAGG